MTNQSNSTDSIELEQAREELRKEIALAEDMEGLLKDERFKRVFLERFMKEIVQEESMGLISTNEIIREVALDKIKSAKYVQAYIDYTIGRGESAKAEMLEGEK